MSQSSKLLIIGIFFLLMIIYILFTSIQDNEVKDYSYINDYINSINNDYMLDVLNNGNEIVYYKQQNIEHYVSNSFENKHYIKENDKLYYVKDNNNVEIEFTNDLDNKYNYDLNLIKKVISHCKYSEIYNRINCTVTYDDYSKELLSLYGVSTEKKEDIKIFFDIEDKKVKKLIMNNYEINILETPDLELLTK